MPIYEYQCSVCGHQLEAFQNMKDAPLKECPNCHKDTLNKLISAAGFQLKGTGWYKTDYNKKPSETKSEKGSDAGKETRSEPTKTEGQKTDSKPTESKADKTKSDKTGSTS